MFLLMKEKRKVSSRGVEFKNLFFWCERLGELIGKTVWVRYDPRSLACVYVYDEENEKYLACHQVPNSEGIVHELSAWEMKMIGANKEMFVEDEVYLAGRRQELRETRDAMLDKNKRARRTSARIEQSRRDALKPSIAALEVPILANIAAAAVPGRQINIESIACDVRFNGGING
jgi:hypothetical protein